jgi:hypothetical protein
MGADTQEYIRRKIASWVQRQFYKPNPRFGTCEKIILRHMRADGVANSEVYTYMAEGGDPSQLPPPEFDLVLGEITMAAAEHADGFGSGVQRYALYSYFTQLPTSPSCFPFLIQSEMIEASADAMPTEPATKEGMLSMQMRHNDAIMRTSVMSMGGVVQALQRNLERFASHNEKLIDDRMGTLHLIEDLINGKHERDLDVKREEFKMGLQTELLDKVKILLPFMVNKMVGKPVLPEPTTPEAILVRSIVETLTVDQVSKLKGVLTPEQLIGMMELAEQMVKQSGEKPGMSNVPKLHAVALQGLEGGEAAAAGQKL